jgi:hypothetical protein
MVSWSFATCCRCAGMRSPLARRPDCVAWPRTAMWVSPRWMTRTDVQGLTFPSLVCSPGDRVRSVVRRRSVGWSPRPCTTWPYARSGGHRLDTAPFECNANSLLPWLLMCGGKCCRASFHDDRREVSARHSVQFPGQVLTTSPRSLGVRVGGVLRRSNGPSVLCPTICCAS